MIGNFTSTIEYSSLVVYSWHQKDLCIWYPPSPQLQSASPEASLHLPVVKHHVITALAPTDRWMTAPRLIKRTDYRP